MHLPGVVLIDFSTGRAIAEFVMMVVTLDMGDLALKLTIPF